MTNHVSQPPEMEKGGFTFEDGVEEKGKLILQQELLSPDTANAPPSITGVNLVRQPGTDGNRYREQNPSISLRKWLSNPGRAIDTVENIHIFKQIAEFVELAHSQGVVLRNIRPSSFLLSSLNRVSIIESASSESTSTSSRSSEESTGRDAMVSAAPAARNEQIGSATRKEQESQHDSVGNTHQKGNIACEIEVTYTDKQESTDVNGMNEGNGKPIMDDTVDSYRPITDVTSEFQEKQGKDEGDKSSASCSDGSCKLKSVKFPLKQILSMELIWYKSPEELMGMTTGFSSDIYSLGVLFFEVVEYENFLSNLSFIWIP
jgi:serine/threonine protein kinase